DLQTHEPEVALAWEVAHRVGVRGVWTQHVVVEGRSAELRRRLTGFRRVRRPEALAVSATESQHPEGRVLQTELRRGRAAVLVVVIVAHRAVELEALPSRRHELEIGVVIGLTADRISP